MITNTSASTIRAELADTIEEIGQAMGLLREAQGDVATGNEAGAKMCGSDALEIISGLESKFSDLAARLAVWTEL